MWYCRRYSIHDIRHWWHVRLILLAMISCWPLQPVTILPAVYSLFTLRKPRSPSEVFLEWPDYREAVSIHMGHWCDVSMAASIAPSYASMTISSCVGQHHHTRCFYQTWCQRCRRRPSYFDRSTMNNQKSPSSTFLYGLLVRYVMALSVCLSFRRHPSSGDISKY